MSDDITAITDDHEVVVSYTGTDLVDINDNTFQKFASVIDVSGATAATYYADGIASTAVNGTGTQITMTFDEVIADATFTTTDFKVKINGIEYDPATVARGTTTTQLLIGLPTGAKAIDNNDVVTVIYNGTTELADTASNAYAAFTKLITVSAAPTATNAAVVTASEVNGAGKLITVDFNADIKAGLNLTEGNFEVLIDGESYTPATAAREMRRAIIMRRR